MKSLTALGSHRDAIVLVGAQGVQLNTLRFM